MEWKKNDNMSVPTIVLLRLKSSVMSLFPFFSPFWIRKSNNLSRAWALEDYRKFVMYTLDSFYYRRKNGMKAGWRKLSISLAKFSLDVNKYETFRSIHSFMPSLILMPLHLHIPLLVNNKPTESSGLKWMKLSWEVGQREKYQTEPNHIDIIIFLWILIHIHPYTR